MPSFAGGGRPHATLRPAAADRLVRRPFRSAAEIVLAVALLLLGCAAGITADSKKQYWATSLAGAVDEGILQGLYAAAERGETGWLDIDPKNPIPPLRPGINLIFYHVGGNCYIGDDCDRFPASEPTGDRWSDSERAIDLGRPATRDIVVQDLLEMIERADEIAPEGAVIGVHLDNVHRLAAPGLAGMFNEFLAAVEAARLQGRISRSRRVGYVAKNNPEGFLRALELQLLETLPLYQINENASLNQAGALDGSSRIAQEMGRRCGFPVFLKAFGSDLAYTVEPGDERILVSEQMAREMAQLPDISGVAWSADEARYHPSLFVQGAPVGSTRGTSGRLCGD